MTLTELVAQVNAAYRGEEDLPLVGTDEYNLWVLTANRKKDEWARDAKQLWSSLYEDREFGTVTFGTQTFDIDDGLITPASEVYVLQTDNQRTEYNIVKPQEAKYHRNEVFLSGRDPIVLTFRDDFIAGSQVIGGTVHMAAYWVPDDIERPNDIIPIDDPYWLVYAVASELAFNDVTYEDKYVDLNTKANNLYTSMVTANRKGTYDNPRTVPTSVNRIGRTSGFRSDRW